MVPREAMRTTFEYEALNDRLMVERGRVDARSCQHARSGIRKLGLLPIEVWPAGAARRHFDLSRCRGWGSYRGPLLKLREDAGDTCTYGSRAANQCLGGVFLVGLSAVALSTGELVLCLAGVPVLIMGLLALSWRVVVRAGGVPKAFRVERAIGPFALRVTEISASVVEGVVLLAERFADNWDFEEAWPRGKPWHYEFVVWLLLSGRGPYQVSHSSCMEFERGLARSMARCLGVPCHEFVEQGSVRAAGVGYWWRAVLLALAGLVVLALLSLALWLG